MPSFSTAPALTAGLGIGQVAGDGQEYFSVLGVADSLLVTYDLLERARLKFIEAAALSSLSAAKTDYVAQALACQFVVREVSDGAILVAGATAVEVDALIKKRIDATQVRPDPVMKTGVRLRDVVKSRAIRSRLVGTLEVGVADISELNRAADAQGRAYWRAQEYGSSHLVGKSLRGVFQPGAVPPDKGRFRLDPEFESTPGQGPVMKVGNPIRERGFLREGVVAAETIRDREFAPVARTAVSEMEAIVTGASSQLTTIRRLIPKP